MRLNTSQDQKSRQMRKVIGLVLIIPLAASITRLPTPSAWIIAIAVMLCGIYGVYLAARQGSHKLIGFALSMVILNTLSLIGLSTYSAAMVLYIAGKFGMQMLMT